MGFWKGFRNLFTNGANVADARKAVREAEADRTYQDALNKQKNANTFLEYVLNPKEVSKAVQDKYTKGFITEDDFQSIYDPNTKSFDTDKINALLDKIAPELSKSAGQRLNVEDKAEGILKWLYPDIQLNNPKPTDIYTALFGQDPDDLSKGLRSYKNFIASLRNKANANVDAAKQNLSTVDGNVRSAREALAAAEKTALIRKAMLGAVAIPTLGVVGYNYTKDPVKQALDSTETYGGNSGMPPASTTKEPVSAQQTQQSAMVEPQQSTPTPTATPISVRLQNGVNSLNVAKPQNLENAYVASANQSTPEAPESTVTDRVPNSQTLYNGFPINGGPSKVPYITGNPVIPINSKLADNAYRDTLNDAAHRAMVRSYFNSLSMTPEQAIRSGKLTPEQYKIYMEMGGL